MKNSDLKNVDCHAALAMIEKRWGFPRRTLRALLGMTKSGQSGRSMIEMLGVLAIIGVLSVGGIAGYSKAMTKYRINKTIEQITLIAGNVRTFFAPQGNFIGAKCYCNDGGCDGVSSNDGCPVIKKAKIIPDEMLTLNNDGDITAITNAFGGGFYIYVTSSIYNKDDNKSFGFNLSQLPEEACIELLSQDWTAVGVTDIGVMYSGGAPKFVVPPAAVDKAVEACTSATINQVHIELDYNYKTDPEVSEMIIN